MSTHADATPRSPASTGSAHLVEEWECRACHKDFPCRVQIHFSPAFTDIGITHSRFRRRHCIAGEPIEPKWQMNPTREESPNDQSSRTAGTEPKP